MSGRDGTRRVLAAFGVMSVVAVLVSGPAGADPAAGAGAVPGPRAAPVAVPLPPPVPTPVLATDTFADCP